MTTKEKIALVKERPILFNGEMVRAILDGRKTQTRRVIKPQPQSAYGGKILWRYKNELRPTNDMVCRNPYGQPGDRLWVRETWMKNPGKEISPDKILHQILYKADGAHFGPTIKWRPSIHMPRWASRITLEIANIRVERVQEVTDSDALAEGVEPWPFGDRVPVGFMEIPQASVKPALKFAVLWDHINSSNGYGWDANPWVWVVEFKRVLTHACGEGK